MKVILRATKETMQHIAKYRRSLFVMIIFIWITGVLAPFLQVVLPSLFLYLIETQQSFATLMVYAGGISLLVAVLDSAHNYLMQTYDPKMYVIKCKLTLRLYEKAMHVPYAQVEDMEYRQLLNRAQTNGIDNSGVGFEHFVRNGMELLIAVTGFFLYAIVFGSMQLWLCALVVTLSLLSIWFMSKAQAYEHVRKQDYAKADQQLQYYHHEVKLPGNGKDIRIFHLQDWLLAKIRYFQKCRVEVLQEVERKYLWAKWGSTFLSAARNLIVFAFFLHELVNGMSVSVFVFYTSAAAAFSGWISKIVNFYNETRRGALGIVDYDTYMDLPIEEEGATLTVPDEDLEIVFDHVSFRYPQAEKDTLTDINFTVHKKEKIGIVGSNGAGKTTLIKLLCGLYTPTSGRILINGIDIKKFAKEDLFTHIAAVFQDSCAMAYSVKKNVACKTKDTIDMDLVWDCLERCELKTKVEQLPLQEDTYISNQISENGVLFSGGEQQKLLMARALYRKANLLILDEPSAALDALAEAALYENYERAAKACTSIFISHRLASTRFANRILLFDQGQLKEMGTHETLLQQNGLYARMFEAQASYYQEGGMKHESTTTRSVDDLALDS